MSLWEDWLAIGSAVQRGSMVIVYDERGVQLFSRTGDLTGHTGSTVSIKKGSTVTTYDDRGSQKFTRNG